jgi:flagellar basal-body rod protein FlgF
MASGSAAAKNCRKQCFRLDFLIGRGSHGLRDLALKHEFGLSVAHALDAMDSLTAIAASGLRSRMESLEMLANNVANAATGGYKFDREFYSLYVAPEAADSEPQTTMPVVERAWTDFSQGPLSSTGNPLDLALTGKGFFSVDGPSGALYTRNGNFRLAADGKLTTEDGYAVRGAGGTSLKLAGAGPIDISGDGTILQDGSAVGQLDIADFTSTAGLVKQGKNYFRATDALLRAAPAQGVSVAQGQLEGSNAGSAEAAVRLISVMRQFEMLQKAVTLGAEMNLLAIQQVAKVGQ